MSTLLCVFVFELLLFIIDSKLSVPVGPYIYYSDLGGKPYTVSYDERSFIINGNRTLLIGGSVHYPRLSPYQWEEIMIKAKNDGLNHIEIYIFWNFHEETYSFDGNHIYNFKGRANLTHFYEIAMKIGMFINLRIGPYVCSEWNFGAIPVWLLHSKNIIMRSSNNEWEKYMETFVNKIGEISIPYLAKNGGPIILAQIENEYYGNDMDYVNWCGQLAKSQNFDIPWIMCNGKSANNTINSCNGNNCYQYALNHNNQYPGDPLVWTENEGWQQEWDHLYDPNHTEWDNRSPQDKSQSVAIWFASGGCHMNYYMYYGGNHISKWAASSITNYYTDGVPYHSDMLPHEPKKTHLTRLHKILANNQEILLSDHIQVHNQQYLYPINATLATYVAICNNDNEPQQQWVMSNNGLLQITINGKTYCITANGGNGNGASIKLQECHDNDDNQQWTYTTNQQFECVKYKTCLDIYQYTGPNVDEWQCKDPNDPSTINQLWSIDGNLIRSNENKSLCLTANPNTFAYIYQSSSDKNSEKLSFLVNMSPIKDYNVPYDGKNYDIPAKSVSIVDNEGNELYNTGKVDSNGLPTKRIYKTIYSGKTDLNFSSWTELIPLQSNPQNRSDKATINITPLEQIRFTNYTMSEYLVYSCYINITSNWQQPTLNWQGRIANAYLVFIDNIYEGEVFNYAHSAGNQEFSLKLTSNMNIGSHIITIISSSLGISNWAGIKPGMNASECDQKGIVGDIYFADSSSKKKLMDITNNNWYHWIGLTGEQLNIYNNPNTVNWVSPIINNKPLTWYKTAFNSPNNTLLNYGPILMDIGGVHNNGMKRGHFYLNGMDLGHYNNVIYASLMTQEYYFIPTDYLTPNQGINTLIFAEELPDIDVNNVNIVVTTVVVP